MITMKDTCKIARVSSDGYGDKTVEVLADIDCLFLQTTSNSHSGNVDIRESDAHAYLDINAYFLVEKSYRIEGYYLIANMFSGNDDDSWYRITRVVIGQRKLLTNEVDNVHVYLKRVAKQEVQEVV